jgi:hypothetical protein
LTSTDWSTFNNKQPAISNATSTEIGYLSGVTSGIQTQLNSKQATISNATSTEIGYLSGVTSAIQTQLNGKLSSATGAASTIISDPLTQNRMLMSEDAAGGKVIVSGLKPYTSITTNDSIEVHELKANSSIGTAGGSAIIYGLSGYLNAIRPKDSQILHIGDINTNKINIGNANCVIDILGSTTYYDVTQLQVKDPLLTVNKGGTSTTSASGCGLEIEESSAITGYVKTSTERDSWLFKAPGKAGVLTMAMMDTNATVGGVGTGLQTKQVFTSVTTESKVATFSSEGTAGTTSVVVTVPTALNGNASVQTYTNQYVLFKKDGQSGTGVTGSNFVTSAVTTSTGLTVTLTLTTALSALASGSYTLQKVTAFTIPASVYSIVAQVVGGGGSGASGQVTGTYTGGGGSSGSFIEATLNVTPGQILYYSIGDGGAQVTADRTVGTDGGVTTINYATSYLFASNGKGGLQGTDASNTNGNGGSGLAPLASGASVISSLLVQGGDGTLATAHGNQFGIGGCGGASYFGQGGLGSAIVRSRVGAAYGSGGGGGGNRNSSECTYGAKGAAGAIILSYFSNVVLPNTYTPVAPLSFSGSNLLCAPGSAYGSWQSSTLTTTGSHPNPMSGWSEYLTPVGITKSGSNFSVTTSGIYMVNCTVRCQCSASIELNATIYKNSVNAQDFIVASSGGNQSIAVNALLSLIPSDNVLLSVRQGAGGTTITVTTSSFIIYRLA